MHIKEERIVAVIVGALATIICGSTSAQTSGDVVHEERTVAVDGVHETWQLVWEGEPAASQCGPHQVNVAITCPCFGFGYAQQGKLFLLRGRAGNPAERLALSPLFAFELDS